MATDNLPPNAPSPWSRAAGAGQHETTARQVPVAGPGAGILEGGTRRDGIALPERVKAGPQRSLPVRVLVFALKACLGFWVTLVALVALFRFVDPPGSALMAIHAVQGKPVNRQWVPLERISPHLVRAVVVAEDNRFCEHRGVDWRELQDAWERSEDGVARGASTITMQVAKNLFLWPARSYIRKVIEIPLAITIDAIWPKRRIIEVYLNIAELGPGVFGAEAAARHHFRKSAARLEPVEAALLAASLPNPIQRNAGRPGVGTRQIAATIMARARYSQGRTWCTR